MTQGILPEKVFFRQSCMIFSGLLFMVPETGFMGAAPAFGAIEVSAEKNDNITPMNSISQASKMHSPIRAILFDCDGTLVDSEEPGLDVLHELACGEGLAITREQANHQFRGVRMAECIAWVASQLPEKPSSFEADFMSQVRAATELRFLGGIDPLPGAHELLSQLKIPFCIASNGPREKIELTLQLSGLRPLLGDRIFSAYDIGSYKPDPGLFLHAAMALGMAPEQCAVVEDSLPGILAGLAAGMTVFALRERTSLPADLAERVTCISSLAELGLRFLDRSGLNSPSASAPYSLICDTARSSSGVAVPKPKNSR